MSEKTVSVAKTQCAECGKFFLKDAGFDLHRVGRFGVDRRCMTTGEMVVSGWRKTSVSLKDDGKKVVEAWG